MKMTAVRLIGLTPIMLPLEETSPSDRYILKSADGLGPPEVDVSMSRTLFAGNVYQGRRPQSREVVLEIGLNADHSAGETAADLREELYGLLTPGLDDIIKIDILNGTVTQAHTEGYVSGIEINPFSSDPQVQITLPCLKPYLWAPNAIFVSPGSTTAPTLRNTGTAPGGFYMEVVFTQAMESWALIDGLGRKMEFRTYFAPGDKLAFDTRPGNRSIRLQRAGRDWVDLIDSLTADSIWHELHGGLNTFSTSSSAFNWGDVTFRAQYWGI